MKFLNNLQVSTKLKLIAAVAALALGVVWFTAHRSVSVNALGGATYQEVMSAHEFAYAVRPPPAHLVEAYVRVHEAVAEPDAAARAALVAEVRASYDAWRAACAEWASVLPDGELKSRFMMDAYAPAQQFFDVFARQVSPVLAQGKLAQAAELTRTALTPLYRQHAAALEAVGALSMTHADALESGAVSGVAVSEYWLIGVGLLALGVVLALSAMIGRQISASIERAAKVIRAVADRNLTTRIEALGTDEIGELAVSVNQAVDGMRTALLAISRQADSLAAASEELNVVSTRMSENAQETAAQASTVTTASEEVTRTVQTVAAASEQMNASIREISENTTLAAKVAGNAVRVAQTTNTTVSKLGDSSIEIGKVIKVINAIAEQTNLLALNATIEAARAGEAGKGFAVVANEVKELAKETAKATEDISQRIEAIQTDTRGAVAAIGEIQGIITQISELQTTVAAAIEEQTATTSEIGRNVGEGARNTAQISNNIAGVATAARGTSAGAHDANLAATELARMATEIRTVVAQFAC